MSLFFASDRSIKVSFTSKSLPEKGGLETALVGKNLWASFGQPESDRIALCIRSLRAAPQQDSSFVCWAKYEEEAHDVCIPPRWLHDYSQIFSRATYHMGSAEKTLTVTMTEPVNLTDVVLSALSADAYHWANDATSALEDWLSEESVILRQGQTYSFTPNTTSNGLEGSDISKSCQFRLAMAEPVLQGVARKGSTRLYVTSAASSSDEPELLDMDAEDASSEEAIEIDESFLASSVLHNKYMSTSGALEHDSGANDQKSTTDQSDDSKVLRTEALGVPILDAHGDCTLYLRTSDLGKVGVLNGDWAVAQATEASDFRLVRVYARDDLVHTQGTAMGSPVLLHNISRSYASATTRISIHTSAFGSRLPAIPTARSVTVARVASPISTDRTYQPLFLRSLKTYFKTKHLAKQGDLIALSLDTDDAGLFNDSLDSDDIVDAEDRDISNQNLPAGNSRANEVVFFIITNLEHDVPHGNGNLSHQDLYNGSTTGELGCWVDSSITSVIQTGLEHSRIPDVASYFGTGSIALPSLSDRTRGDSQNSPFSKLLALSSATMARRAIDYDLHTSILLKGARGVGKFTAATWVARQLGLHLLEINCYDVIGENDTKTEGTLRFRFEKAGACSPCVLVLRHLDALSQTTQALDSGKESIIENVLRECFEDLRRNWKLTGHPVLVYGTTSETSKVAPGVLASFKHEVAFEAPSESERYDILSTLLIGSLVAPDVSLSALATQTAALVASDLVDLVDRARLTSIERTRIVTTPAENATLTGLSLVAADFDAALGKARASYSQSIGAPNIPNVSWDDVGGLAHVKSDILDTIQLPLDHPELFADGLKKRSGILLYGPPGTGKTLLAKAVATSCSLNFFSIKGPELLNMYIGESEANVRRVFQRARDAKPCVIFFDELDSVAPKRGNQGDSGGVMDRIVSQLLAELDGMSDGKGGSDVFVIGATNRPDLLDPALLRPGRFDRMLYLGVSDNHKAQFDILQALTRKFRLDKSLDLWLVAERCPFNYTGADFYALCSDAMLNAMSRKAEEIDAKLAVLNAGSKLPGHPFPLTPQYYLAEMASQEEMEVLVSQEDFERAFHDLVPSVSQSEMDHYATIQSRFSRKKVEHVDPLQSQGDVVAGQYIGGKGKGKAVD